MVQLVALRGFHWIRFVCHFSASEPSNSERPEQIEKVIQVDLDECSMFAEQKIVLLYFLSVYFVTGSL